MSTAPARVVPVRDATRSRLPALATVHSHAFQRGMRGLAQRPPGEGVRSDFWSWRGAMYAAASALTPESLARVSRVAFDELVAAGVRTVGEFHYVHHADDGTPYAQRTLLADVVVEQALAAGLRVALLRVAYHRAGPGRAAEPGQRRFCDPSVDDVLRDVDALRARWGGRSDVVVGLAPHSVRAVPPSWIPELARYADAHGLPFHMHVSEQVREIDECVAETGQRPVELLADLGALSRGSSPCTPRTSRPTRRSCSARPGPRPASAPPPSAISATAYPTSVRSARTARGWSRASTAT